MGQAKNKQRITKRLLSTHRFCCFCGGLTEATSTDHVPPRIVFWGKHRPAGLEVPACDACNQGTRKLDQVAGIFSRIRVAGDHSPKDRAEFGRIVDSVSRSFPGWNSEMMPSEAQIAAFHGKFGLAGKDMLPANLGPLSHDAIYVVGAKLGFALHYQLAGKIVPPDGFVVVRFETNASIPEGGLPAEFTRHLGPPAMLAQGQWTTDGHFAYRSAIVPGGAAGAYVSHIGRAFLTIAFVFCDGREISNETSQSRIFRPGDLKRADATAIARYRQATAAPAA